MLEIRSDIRHLSRLKNADVDILSHGPLFIVMVKYMIKTIDNQPLEFYLWHLISAKRLLGIIGLEASFYPSLALRVAKPSVPS